VSALGGGAGLLGDTRRGVPVLEVRPAVVVGPPLLDLVAFPPLVVRTVPVLVRWDRLARLPRNAARFMATGGGALESVHLIRPGWCRQRSLAHRSQQWREGGGGMNKHGAAEQPQ